MAVNETVTVPLAGKRAEAVLVRKAHRYAVEGRAIVLNLGPSPAYTGPPPHAPLRPLTSTTLVDGMIEDADAVLVLHRTDDDPVELTRTPGWQRFSELLPAYPADVPLWRGPRHDLGPLLLDVDELLGETEHVPLSYQLWVNLWYAPAGTDCGLHVEHPFLEVHTQVQGLGRMQKFAAEDPATLYEDVPQSPGNTHPPFCRRREDGFGYPWHQYKADTDCAWLAVELHQS